jgi:hypothetical protein
MPHHTLYDDVPCRVLFQNHSDAAERRLLRLRSPARVTLCTGPRLEAVEARFARGRRHPVLNVIEAGHVREASVVAWVWLWRLVRDCCHGFCRAHVERVGCASYLDLRLNLSPPPLALHFDLDQ